MSATRTDGGYGWVVVMAYFMSSVIIDALRYAFGIMYIEFLAEFRRGKGETAWIGSLMLCVYNILGPVMAVGINRFGVRIGTATGAIIATVGLLASSFPDQIYPLFFTYGALQGFGLGLMHLGGWVAVGRYFEKKRGLALGIAQCGCGVGAFAVSPVLTVLIDVYAWRGAMLILAGVCLNGCALSMLYRPFVEGWEYNVDVEQEVGNDTVEKKANEVAVENEKLLVNGDMLYRPIVGSREKNDIGAEAHTDTVIINDGDKEQAAEHYKDFTQENDDMVEDEKLLRGSTCSSHKCKDNACSLSETNKEDLDQIKCDKLESTDSVLWHSSRSLNFINTSPRLHDSDSSEEGCVGAYRCKTDTYDVTSSIESQNTVVSRYVKHVKHSERRCSGSQSTTSQYDNADLQLQNQPPGSGNTCRDTCKVSEARYFSWTPLERLFPRRLVTDARMLLLLASAFFYSMAAFIPIMLIADYGRWVGCTEGQVGWFVSAIGLGGTLGRVVCGFIVDVKRVSNVWFLTVMLAMCSVSSFLYPLMTTFPVLITASLVYGLCIGALYVVPGVILVEMYGEKLIAETMGVLMYMYGVVALVGAPVAGWLFDVTGSYVFSFVFTGSLFLLAAIFNGCVNFVGCSCVQTSRNADSYECKEHR